MLTANSNGLLDRVEEAGGLDTKQGDRQLGKLLDQISNALSRRLQLTISLAVRTNRTPRVVLGGEPCESRF